MSQPNDIAPPPGAPMYILPDKEQELTTSQMFAGARPTRIQDRFSIIIHLLDERLKWIHTNIQNNNILMRILQARTWKDISEETYKPLYHNSSPELTDDQRAKLKFGFEEINKTMLNITDNYAALRLGAKGFRAKQVERMISGDVKNEKELDKIFKDRGANKQ